VSTKPLLRQPPTPPPWRRRTSWSLRPSLIALAGACALGVWVLQRVFVQSPRGQGWDEGWRVDVQSAAGQTWIDRSHDFGVLSLQIGLLSCAVLAVVVILRRRWDLLVRGVVLVAGANATTQVLKHSVIERPGYAGFGPNALPSGHVTLVTSLVFVAFIVASAQWRPLIAVVGCGWIAAIAVATVVSGWHRPSDTVAALLVCVGWAALVSAVRFRRWPPSVPPTEGYDPRFAGR
jgi:membrane-associated phospholipid phosphatase